jgi:hypothetical protein
MKLAALVVVAVAAVALVAAAWDFVDKYEGTPPDVTPVPTLTHWAESDGAPVSRDALVVVRGPEHCNWESSLMLFTGDPIGSAIVRGRSERQYVRDPEGVYPDELLLIPYDGDVDRPSHIFPTGYSWEGGELWVDRVGPDIAAYMVYDDHIERWPRTAELIRCA